MKFNGSESTHQKPIRMQRYRSFQISLITLFIIVGSVTRIDAQEAKTAKPQITFLAIGSPPPITLTTTREGGSTYDEPSKSEYPPVQLYYKKNKQSKYQEVRVALNRPSSSFLTKSDSSRINLYTKKGAEETPDATPYVSLTLPEQTSDMTVIFTRNTKTNHWRSKPNVSIFQDDLISFPEKSLRVANFSETPVKLKIGNAVFILEAHKKRVFRLPAKDQGVLPFAVFDLKKNKLLVHSGISYYKNSRKNLVIYAADGEHEKLAGLGYSMFDTERKK